MAGTRTSITVWTGKIMTHKEISYLYAICITDGERNALGFRSFNYETTETE